MTRSFKVVREAQARIEAIKASGDGVLIGYEDKGDAIVVGAASSAASGARSLFSLSLSPHLAHLIPTHPLHTQRPRSPPCCPRPYASWALSPPPPAPPPPRPPPTPSANLTP